LHADPEFARAAGFAQPILHGLATFGFIARAVIRNACAGDGDRLLVLSAQFRRPVLPGDTLTTVGFEVNGQVAVKAFTADGGELVVTNCYAEVAPKP
jgi:acyl dehydratase